MHPNLGSCLLTKNWFLLLIGLSTLCLAPVEAQPGDIVPSIPSKLKLKDNRPVIVNIPIKPNGWAFSFALDFQVYGDFPVSYTHLEVYKRQD